MAKRSYDPAKFRSLLAERMRHGWSLGELSRRSGVAVGTLSSWAARARRAPAMPAERGFDEVIVPSARSSTDAATVVLRNDAGCTAELHGDAALALAAKLAEAITRCC